MHLKINSDRKATFKIQNAHYLLGEDKLTIEIQEVLSDSNRLKVFIDDLLKVFENYRTKTLNPREKALRAAIRRKMAYTYTGEAGQNSHLLLWKRNYLHILISMIRNYK